MTNTNITLTSAETERELNRALAAMRLRLQARKPNAELYDAHQSRATRYITAILVWSKLFIPVIALLSGLASSVRTIQTAAEIYTASGSSPIGVFIAAVGFTVGAEACLFALALTQESQRMRLRAERRPRHVVSLKSLWRGVAVRIGLREPLGYDELNEQGRTGTVMAIAFIFAVSANAYMGFRPLVAEIGAVSLQSFFASLWSAPASLQLKAIADIASILFPPLMTYSAGHLTARFAAEIATQSQEAQSDYERDTMIWRVAYANPLESDEGQALLKNYMEEKLHAKTVRLTARQNGSVNSAFLAPNGEVTPSIPIED